MGDEGSAQPRSSALRVATSILLQRVESYDLELKRNIGAVEPKTLVSFANSETGGVILAGVDEEKDERGQQRAKVVGTRFGDQERRDLQSRAEQCLPPVPIVYTTEEIDGCTIVRIEVESSPNKPHCTNGGTYQVRRDGKGSALSPTEMLAVFLEREATEFLRRFKEATTALSKDVRNFEERMRKLQKTFGEAEARLSNLIADATDHAAAATASAMDSASEAEAAAATAERAASTVESVQDELGELYRAIEGLGEETHKEFERVRGNQEDVSIWLEEIALQMKLTATDVYENTLRRTLKSHADRWKLTMKGLAEGPSARPEMATREVPRELLEHVAENFQSVGRERRAVIVGEVLAEANAPYPHS